MSDYYAGSPNPFRVYRAQMFGLGALAAGAERTTAIVIGSGSSFPGLPRAWANNTYITLVCCTAVAEANVLYVAEVDEGASTQTILSVKVRQVGSAAAANGYSIQGIIIDRGDIIGFGG